MGTLNKQVATFLFVSILISATFILTYGSPCPPPSSTTHHVSKAKCPVDTLKFGVCGSWLGLVREVVGTKPSKECCALVKGLADSEAAVCFCGAIKADVLGAIKLKVPVALSLFLNGCGKSVPDGFRCT